VYPRVPESLAVNSTDLAAMEQLLTDGPLTSSQLVSDSMTRLVQPGARCTRITISCAEVASSSPEELKSRPNPIARPCAAAGLLVS